MYCFLIAVLIYIGMVVFHRYRTTVATLGAGILIFYGFIEGFYSPDAMLQKVPIEVMILILVLSLFSKVFEEEGVLNFLGVKAIGTAKGRIYLTIGVFLMSIYAFSLFANNLSVILVFTFVCLRIATALQLPPVPLLVGSIVASNIGGAALPWADTPAIILTIYTNFNIWDFLFSLFPICLLFILLLILYTIKKVRAQAIPIERFEELINFESINYLYQFQQIKWKSLILPAMLFFLLILGLCIAPFFNVRISYPAILFGGLLLVIKGKRAMELLNDLNLTESFIFISALFLIAGALEASKSLDVIIQYLKASSVISPFISVIGILLSAFLMATFLSAGPACITLLPLCNELVQLEGKIVYVALALGILAGSSMLPFSATGGPIMLNEVKRFLEGDEVDNEDTEEVEKIFILKNYAKFSIPFSLFILISSTFWLYLLSCLT